MPARAAKAQGLALTPDPLPDRNSFTRTDQFSFVRAGSPGAGVQIRLCERQPEFDIEHDWRANRYHAPDDDLLQPGVLADEAVKLDDLVTAIARQVANAPTAPGMAGEQRLQAALMRALVPARMRALVPARMRALVLPMASANLGAQVLREGGSL